MAKIKEDKNLNEYLKEISNITEWFNNQTEIDLEEAIKKVQEANELITKSKEKLGDVENSFQKIEKEISGLE